MFHVKQLLVFICMLSLVEVMKAQGTITLEDKVFNYDSSRVSMVDKFLEQFPILQKQSEIERDVYYWTDVLRADPKQFLKTYVIPFLNQFPEAKGSSANSLISDLKNLSALPLFAPRENLIKASRSHSIDLAKHNRISHNSSDGK